MTSTRSRRARPRAALLLLVAGTLAACATNPVSGKRELALISQQQEVQMGQQAAREAARTYGLVADQELQAYVSALGRKLAAGSERPDLPWSFAVVDDPTPNAFALPGGPIFVTRGLLALMTSEAELASVLGHEIGHVTARHSVSQMSKQQLAQLGVGLGSILIPGGDQLAGLASQGLGLLFLKYGRDDERQADALGFRYALDQGYDVREMAKVFESLQRSGELEGGGRGLPSWASSHPAEPERIASVQKRVAALGADYKPGRSGRDEFMRQIDGLTYGENPRDGYFRAGTFYHPEMRFQFTVPADWKKQNSASAVMAVSARQDAAMQLTLVPGGGSPEDAARKFVAQEGMQAGDASRQRYNGVPAVVVPFQAQAQQGAVQGYATFLDYGGATFQLVTYAPGPAAAQYDTTFRQIIASFGPVTDRRILDAQPQKIDVVKTDRAASFADFVRRNAGPVPAERLALINQVDDMNRQIPAGTLMKRVVGGTP